MAMLIQPREFAIGSMRYCGRVPAATDVWAFASGGGLASDWGLASEGAFASSTGLLSRLRSEAVVGTVGNGALAAK